MAFVVVIGALFLATISPDLVRGAPAFIWITCTTCAETPEIAINGNTLTLGQVGDTEGGSQNMSIHGAAIALGPAKAYKVTFSFDLATWDSYNTVGTPNPPYNAGTGYWDSFSISIAQQPYWNLALSDPLGVDDPLALGFRWGGTSYGDGTLETYTGTRTVYIPANTNSTNYLNVVLDTRTLPEANHIFPSWGTISIINVEAITGTNDKVLNVPYFDQATPPWSSFDEYDTASQWTTEPPTIARWGCALSSAAMILQSYGITKLPNCTNNACPELVGREIDPRTLNAWLQKEPKGYMEHGRVNWWTLETLTSNAKKLFGTTILDFSWGRGTKEQLETQVRNEIAAGRPVMVYLGERIGHFVVAKGHISSKSTFALNDPDLNYAPELLGYGDAIDSLRNFSPASTDLSRLAATIEAPADLLMIDSQGRRTGFDPETGTTVEQIPNSTYFTEGPLLDDGGSGHASGPEIRGVDVEVPSAGTYTLLVIAHEQQTLEITFYRYDREAQPTITSDTREIVPGESLTYLVTFDLAPGAPFPVKLLVPLDIKPGSAANSVKLRSRDVIPVAILTTGSFDATTVDPISVRFGPNGAIEAHNRGHIQDVDGDGDRDMVLHFKVQETGIARTDTKACIVGRTVGGQEITGCDVIRPIP